MGKLSEYVEIYKCAVLTVIALILAGIWLNTPVPFTPANLRSKRVGMERIPLVRVYDGEIEVSNTVQVEGTVSIERYLKEKRLDSEIKLGLLNLHDAFLNAALMEREKWNAPIDQDPSRFHICDHGRFERLWVTFLYVLIEAWRSNQMAKVRDYIASVTPVGELTMLLDTGQADGSLARMYEVRNYMCHRDRRNYWDDGRLAVCAQLDYHMKVQAAFSKVLLAAVQAAGADT